MEEQSLSVALAAAQGELKNPEKSKKNPHFKSRYAGLDDLLRAVRPVLSKHGIAFTQVIEMHGGSPVLVTRLWVGDGSGPNELRSHYPLSWESNPQKQGSALTYARRYSLEAIVGVAGTEDDDGNAAAVVLPAQPEPKPEPRGKTSDYARILSLGQIDPEELDSLCAERGLPMLSAWPIEKRVSFMASCAEGTARARLRLPEVTAESESESEFEFEFETDTDTDTTTD